VIALGGDVSRIDVPWFVFVLQFCVAFGNASSDCLAQTEPPSFRSESNVVLVPTLVRTKSGNIVHGLSAQDFILQDDGVEQRVQLDDSPEADAISVVLAVQRGRTAALQLEKYQTPSPGREGISKRPLTGASLSGLGTMLESYVGESKAEVARRGPGSDRKAIEGRKWGARDEGESVRGGNPGATRNAHILTSRADESGRGR
jgi:hypothetical protein